MSDSQKTVKIIAILLAAFIIFIMICAALKIVSFLIGLGRDKSLEGEAASIETYENIKSLDVDLESTNLEIYGGDEFKIEKYDTKDTLSVEITGNTLKIKERSRLFWNSSMGGTVVIYVPSREYLDEIELDMGAGKVSIEDVSAQKLSIAQGAGTLAIKSSSFMDTKIDGGAGKISISDSTLQNLDLDAGVGSIDISGKILGRSDIDSGVGAIKLKLEGGKDAYTLNVEKGIGSIKIDGVDTSGVYGTGANYIKIDGGVGSITVDFD